jgi:hypothetical protein
MGSGAQKAARAKARPPRPQGRRADLVVVDDPIFDDDLDHDAVDFLATFLPPEDGDKAQVEDARRRLGGQGLQALGGRGFVLEFSRPFRNQEWQMLFRVRVMKRPRMTDMCDLELLTTQTVTRALAVALRSVSKQLGIRVLNPRRGRETDSSSAGQFDNELGYTGRL